MSGSSERVAGPGGRSPFNFFFSEMAVSDHHGGGITLQRVVGPDLDGFDMFVHPGGFALDAPPIQRHKSKSIRIDFWPETTWCRTLLGCTLANRLSRRRALRRAFCRRAERRMRALLDCRHELRSLVCPQGDLVPRIMAGLLSRRRFPYAAWVMDDHCLRWQANSWSYDPELARSMRALLSMATQVFVISPALGEFYRDRFGVESEVLLPPADAESEPVFGVSPPNGPCRLAYFGNLGSWATQTLKFITPLLETANAALDIFGPTGRPPATLTGSRVHFKGSMAREMVAAEMRKYDALVLPISFSEGDRHLSEFNIATRMSTYLASGTVTLVIGPPYAAMVRYLQPEDAAVVVASLDPEAIRKGIGATRDAAVRRRVLSNARNLVNTRLSTAIVRAKWREGWGKVMEARG